MGITRSGGRHSRSLLPAEEEEFPGLFRGALDRLHRVITAGTGLEAGAALNVGRIGHGNLLPMRHETIWLGPLPVNRYPASGAECASPGACLLSADVGRLGSHSQP
jgi:hypothetical protein